MTRNPKNAPNTANFYPLGVTFFCTFDPSYPQISLALISQIRQDPSFLSLQEGMPLAITLELVQHLLDCGGRRLFNEDFYPSIELRLGYVRRGSSSINTEYTLLSHGQEIKISPQNLLSPFVLEHAHIQYLHFHYWMQAREKASTT